MKLIVSREELKSALEVCGKLVNLRAHVETLRCVRIEAKAGKATVSATNLEEWATITLDEASIEHEGVCVADLAELRAFVKDAQPRRHIEIESDDVAVKVATDINGSSIARGIKAGKLEDWPEFPKAPMQLSKVSPGFLEGIRQAAPSTSSKDFRRALACVYVSEGLAVATDGHHLVALPCPSPFEKSFLIRTSKAIDFLKGDSLAALELPEKGVGKLHVVCENIAYTANLCDAQYPNWRQVVPNEKTMRVSVLFGEKGATELLKAIPALKSAESGIALRCSKDGVFAGSSLDNAVFKTGAGSNTDDGFGVELMASNLSRALELGMNELRMVDAFSPVLFKSEAGAFMASMPIRSKNAIKTATPKTENEIMSKQEESAKPTTQQPQTPAASFQVVKPAPQSQQQADPFDELLKSAEEVKAAARNSYEAASLFARKLRDAQVAIKRKDREQRTTKELIEKLKQASGF